MVRERNWNTEYETDSMGISTQLMFLCSSKKAASSKPIVILYLIWGDIVREASKIEMDGVFPTKNIDLIKLQQLEQKMTRYTFIQIIQWKYSALNI